MTESSSAQPFNDAAGPDAGQARVYQLNDAGAWVQVGQDINGENAGDQSGRSVSMNAAGTRVIIGAPLNDANGSNSGQARVYQLNGNTWVPVGDDIDGEAVNDFSGGSVAMNAAGTKVIIGADGNDGNGDVSGHARVFTFDGAAWVQVGLDIEGAAAGDQSGFSVSMNAAGTTVAIGAPGNDDAGGDSGHARVYQLIGAAWVQVGVDIGGEDALDFSGYSVSMNAAGDRVIIGAPLNDANGNNSGHARVFTFNGNTWVQVGPDINGEAANDQSGFSVAMNAAGTRVAIGADRNDGNGTNSGHVRVYQLNGYAWEQVGLDIEGAAAFDNSGWSVAMNAAGTTVAIGAIGNDDAGGDSGHVRVFTSLAPPAPAAPVCHGVVCEGVTVLEGPNECGVVKVQVPSGLMGLLDLSVPVSVDTNQVVFEGLLPSDGIISFTYPDGSGPVFTFGATLLNGGYGGNYTSTVTILAPTTAPAAGCEPATETADTETAETAAAPEAVAAVAVAAPLLAFTGTGSGLTQLALAITGAGALMMTASRRRR